MAKTENDEEFRMRLIKQKGGTSHAMVITILVIILLTQLMSGSLLSS